MKRARLLLAIAALAACDTVPVKPWEREALARQDMAWDADPLLCSYRRRTQFSKEGSSGDTVLAGGGCGCN
jgi:Domain of unknown function (DUF4266)